MDAITYSKVNKLEKYLRNKASDDTGDIIYGFKIVQGRSEPKGRVEYLSGSMNENYEPAYMDYTNGIFNYGSWKDAWFMPRPCMLKSDGTIAYYLDPDNYAYKEDGTTSDIADLTFDGNAMMQWPKIWVSRIAVGGSYICRIANYKPEDDNSFHCYSNTDANGDEIPHFYTPIYNGHLNNSKLRSISGKAVMNAQTGSNEITYALANNPTAGSYESCGWYIEQNSDRNLINDLLVLIGRSTNVQSTFGNGHYSGGQNASSLIATGTMNTKGLFWGTNGTGNGVKVFGMEHYWGNQWRRTAGLLYVSGYVYAKATWSQVDGTSVTGYQQTAVTGYKQIGTLAQSLSGSYIIDMTVDDFGLFPTTGGGTDSTYYCDGVWSGTTAVTYALAGGGSGNGLACGAWAVALSNAVSISDWAIGAALSCKPLKSIQESDERAA